jgi:hypothetical protein
MAPETESAETRKTAVIVAFLGAKKPKLAKMIVSWQNMEWICPAKVKSPIAKR